MDLGGVEDAGDDLGEGADGRDHELAGKSAEVVASPHMLQRVLHSIGG